jgi:hypothetical protein
MAVGSMDEAESSWVQRFVSAGAGSEEDARLIYSKMATRPETPKKVKSSQIEAQVAEAESSSEPPQTMEESDDLFGALAPIPPKATETPDSQSPKAKKKKVGRPQVDWAAREKSQQELDLFRLSIDIEEKNARESNNMGFIATAMIYASLPHSEIEGAIFKRKNSDISLTIMNDPEIGLPFGKIPRIITAFLCTEAKRQEFDDAPQVINLGRSQAEFAKKLGLSTSGGERGDTTRLKDQSKRLFTSHITLIGQPDSQFHFRNMNLVEEGMLLWSPHDVNEKASWNSQLTLSDRFYKECIAHSVPLDMRVIHSLRSPLAIDIYVWMTYRYNAVKYPTPISWRQLKWQFGSNYSEDAQGMRNFISNFKAQLRKVASVYREAKFTIDKDKLTLHPSRPHILPPPPKAS